MPSDKTSKSLIVIVVAVILGMVAFALLTMPDQRTTGERIGDAVDALPQGPGAAAEQLEKRTPGEKLGDKIKDATDRE